MTLREALAERLRRPQRHRLLQGYPAVPAMEPAVSAAARTAHRDALALRGPDGALRALDRDELDRDLRAPADELEPPAFALDRDRALLVGVLPHTQCIPTREGCGFCTFPHDPSNPDARRTMLERVLDDARELTRHPGLAGRKVAAIYLGGGTANLSKPEELTAIVTTLATRLRIDEAELTLEGTAHLFDRWLSSHLSNLAKLPVGSRRISLGQQTFEASYLRMMGREHFGDAALVRRLVHRARKLRISTSCDLLYNLPEQTLELMRRDVATAIDLGLEQVCLYHLVLYEGLGTPWSREPEFLAALPDNERACDHWLALRAQLLAAGYVQSTLTNFERADVAAGPQRFRYEVASFSVESTDALGVGPMSLSSFVSPAEGRGLKLLRRKKMSGPPWSGDDLCYRYDAAGLRALFVTRGLAKTRLDLRVYEQLFARSLRSDAAEALDALLEAKLVTLDEDTLALTPRGMFFADAVVSLLVQHLPRSDGSGLHTRDLLRERPHPGRDYLGMG